VRQFTINWIGGTPDRWREWRRVAAGRSTAAVERLAVGKRSANAVLTAAGGVRNQ
jgi:hypothetical protein